MSAELPSGEQVQRSSAFVELAISLVLFLLVLAPTRVDAVGSGYGGFGFIDSNLTHCFWERAQYRVPSNSATYTLDYNAWAYKEPSASCNNASPWSNWIANEVQVYAELWTSAGDVLCNTFNGVIVPSGWVGPYGIGRAYRKPSSGACATTSFAVKAYARYSTVGNYSYESGVIFSTI